MLLSSSEPQQLSSSQREDLRLASSKLSGINRRYFQASISIKYCKGNARLTEVLNRTGYRLRKVVKAKPKKAESVRSGLPTMQPNQAK